MDRSNEIRIMNPSAQGFSSNPKGTFMPNMLAISVGRVSKIVTPVIRFIIVFTLFEITLAKASMVPVKISV